MTDTCINLKTRWAWHASLYIYINIVATCHLFNSYCIVCCSNRDLIVIAIGLYLSVERPLALYMSAHDPNISQPQQQVEANVGGASNAPVTAYIFQFSFFSRQG